MRQAAEDKLWPPGFAVWLKIAVLHARATHRLADLLRPHALTVAQHDALAHLYVDDGISQQALAQRLLVSKGNVTGLVNRLADQGLVERRDDPEDRRARRITLTAAGRRTAEKALREQAKLVASMMSVLSDKDQETLRRLLDRMAQQLR